MLLAHQQGSLVVLVSCQQGRGQVRGQFLQRWRAESSPEIYGDEVERRFWNMEHQKMMLALLICLYSYFFLCPHSHTSINREGITETSITPDDSPRGIRSTKNITILCVTDQNSAHVLACAVAECKLGSVGMQNLFMDDLPLSLDTPTESRSERKNGNFC